MKIHEYQAKDLLKQFNIPIPKGFLAKNLEDALKAWEGLNNTPLVVKAQVHSGGRGKAGGVRVVYSKDELLEFVSKILGSILITEQSGHEGKPVDAVLIEEAIEAQREIYIAFTLNRSKSCISMLISPEGGIEIEKIAASSPEKILIQDVEPLIGLRNFQVLRLLLKMGIDIKQARNITEIAMSLYRLFIEKDCSLAEINPLVITHRGDLFALDAKINFDDNALFRHPEILSLRDYNQENRLEIEASRFNLNYIKLKGNVGCMVNGAGLAMATMDLIKLVGAEPANFLDVGGGATSGMVKEGLKILVSDKDVRVIFINIFGGILRCDTLAQGVVEAAQELEIKMPIVIRLEGTNVDEGRRVLNESKLTFIPAKDMGEAALLVKEALNKSL